jgi:hypothetical protein
MAVVMARKKHSARRGGRVRKGNLAPPNAQRRDEIVEEVVENLRPWKNHNSRDTVKAEVNHEIDVLLKIVPLQKKLFDPRPARKHAKKLDKALSNVEELLASSPASLALFLFDPMPPPQLLDTPIVANDAEYFLVDRFSDKSIEEIMCEHQTRADAFVADLRRLRKVCSRDYGLHPNYDHAKNLSA